MKPIISEAVTGNCEMILTHFVFISGIHPTQPRAATQRARQERTVREEKPEKQWQSSISIAKLTVGRFASIRFRECNQRVHSLLRPWWRRSSHPYQERA